MLNSVLLEGLIFAIKDDYILVNQGNYVFKVYRDVDCNCHDSLKLNDHVKLSGKFTDKGIILCQYIEVVDRVSWYNPDNQNI